MVVTLDPQTARYLETFQALKPSERKLVTETLKQFTSNETVDPVATALAESIAGKTYTRSERIQLEMETLARHFQHRRQLLDTVLSASQVAQLLGTSRQTPHDRVSSQTLLAIKENGKLCFPSWQFDPAGADGVIDGLPALLKALQMSDYSKLNWLTRPNPVLDSSTPIEALKQGQKERVLAEAAAVGAV
jgi:RNase H-fold protein (predicted Holliday junction resolvase)